MNKSRSALMADCRGGSVPGFLFATAVAIFVALLTVQLAGPFLVSQLDDATRGLMRGRFAGLANALQQTTGCETSFGGGCPVRMVATATGYPGLGALHGTGSPAFLVAASPQGR